MSEQPYLKNGVERLRHRMEVLDGSPLMTVPPEVIREVLTRLEQAEQAVARVREALSGHPRTCDQHTEDDPVKCGWKRAVIDVQSALDGESNE
ncbi:hypothetical protein [Glutamicibacter sp. AOP5-A2-18]|uniref:hypothetical protein n=1 Tax=Glutamicibacter sp. AOP5-A2-18 TaxID=3457656 RepID=UPI0040347AF1